MDIIIVISLVILLALGALFVIPKSQNKGKSNKTNSGANGMTSKVYTKEDVSKHNTRKDCWIIIKDKVVKMQWAPQFVPLQFLKAPKKGYFGSSNNFYWWLNQVYDVTSYVEEHPGGDAILNNAGGDSTEGFFGPQHGTRVFDIIDDFCVGELKAS